MSGKIDFGTIGTSRWALGARLVDFNILKKDVLRPIFNGAMKEIAEINKVNFAPSIVERVWDVVLEKNISELQDVFLVEFCQQILVGFEECQIDKMLFEYIEKGSVITEPYCALLKTSIIFHKKLICDAFIIKNYSRLNDWMPVILKTVELETGLAINFQ